MTPVVCVRNYDGYEYAQPLSYVRGSVEVRSAEPRTSESGREALRILRILHDAPEEIQGRDRDAEIGNGPHPAAAQAVEKEVEHAQKRSA